MNNKINAIIITYNPDIELLSNEYTSIHNQVAQLIYIDNNSRNRDEIQQWVLNKPKTVFIGLQNNEGIAYAQNIGIKKALADEASHIILFDQDSVVDANFIDSLLNAEKKAIFDGLNVGITGPIYKSPTDGYLYPITTFDGKKYLTIPFDSTNEYICVSHVIASGELIRKEVIDKVGFMREDLFISEVDIEYCFRATSFGFKIIRAPKAKMNHIMGDNQIKIFGRKIGLYSPFRRYFTCRNGLLLRKDKFFPKKAAMISFRTSILRFVVSVIWGPQRIKQIIYCIRGFWDGYKYHSGKCPLI